MTLPEIRFLFVGLEQTLARRRKLYPHVVPALEVLSRFEAQQGRPLRIGLVHDSGTLDEGARPGQIREDLRELGLSGAFRCPSKQVVVSASPAPSRERFETLMHQLGGPEDLRLAAVLTGRRLWIRGCRSREMAVLRFARSAKVDRDFGDWAEAPLVVASRLFPHESPNLQIALQLFLKARHELELVSVQPWPEAGPLSVTAKAWQPLKDKRLGALAGVHIQLPVQVRVDLTGPPLATIAPPDRDALAEIGPFVHTLQRQGNIQEASRRRRLAPSVTHVIEEDSSGRRRLSRRRFSA